DFVNRSAESNGTRALATSSRWLRNRLAGAPCIDLRAALGSSQTRFWSREERGHRDVRPRHRDAGAPSGAPDEVSQSGSGPRRFAFMPGASGGAGEARRHETDGYGFLVVALASGADVRAVQWRGIVSHVLAAPVLSVSVAETS